MLLKAGSTEWGGGRGSLRSLWGDLQSWLPAPRAGGILGCPRGSPWTLSRGDTLVRLPALWQEQVLEMQNTSWALGRESGSKKVFLNSQQRIRQNTRVHGTPRGLSPYTFLKKMNEQTLHLKLPFQKHNWKWTPARLSLLSDSQGPLGVAFVWTQLTLTLLLSLPLPWEPDLKTSGLF